MQVFLQIFFLFGGTLNEMLANASVLHDGFMMPSKFNELRPSNNKMQKLGKSYYIQGLQDPLNPEKREFNVTCIQI